MWTFAYDSMTANPQFNREFAEAGITLVHFERLIRIGVNRRIEEKCGRCD